MAGIPRVLGAIVLASLTILMVAVGCKTKKEEPPKPPPPPTSVLMRVISAPDLNPNDKGEATPLDLRIYQLTERPTFTEASFEELWTKDKAVLGATLLGEATVLNFRPGAKGADPTAHEIKLSPKTKFLGLMGLFSAERKEGLEERKLVVTVPEAGISVIVLTKHKIVLQAPKKEAAPPPSQTKTGESKTPAKTTESKTPAKTGESMTPAKTSESKTPAKTSESKAPKK